MGGIPRLIDEVKGIAEENDWEYSIVDDDFDVELNGVLARLDSGEQLVIDGSLGLKGIIVSVDPKTEQLAILFDRSGVLTDMMQQVLWIHNNVRNERFTACKTQFGSIDSHIRIIELFEALKKRYISGLAVKDEGAYWESRDDKLLAEKRTVLDHYMRHTERAIGSIEISGYDFHDSGTTASHIEEALLKADKEGESRH